MKLYNLNDKFEIVTLKEATIKGMGSKNGLYFPEQLPHFATIEDLLAKDFITRSITIAKAMLGEYLSSKAIDRVIKNSFNFPIVLRSITEKIFALELFHGPTLAFKDFGARFMANLLLEFNSTEKKPITILTATSGDTGAAVAHAFYNMKNVQVVILYPYQRISELQEKLFCTLGNNIHTLAVQADFDTCQTLVKQCFLNKQLVNSLGLNSANSINIGRLLAQCFYYFEAVAQLPQREKIAIAVPCGNFGNLSAGLFAQQMGLPVQSFIIATNSNDTVPRYLKTGLWNPSSTKATLSNAMDVSEPNNWPRIMEFYSRLGKFVDQELYGVSLSESDTIDAMHELHELGYIAEPHSAIAYAGLKNKLKGSELGIFLCTAHPTKFKQTVEEILSEKINLPLTLQNIASKAILSKIIPPTNEAVQTYLLKNLNVMLP